MIPQLLYSWKSNDSKKPLKVFNKWDTDDNFQIIKKQDDRNVFERSLDNATDLTKSIVGKVLEKVDSTNFGTTIIDSTSETAVNTKDSVNDVVSNISSFTNILNSENIVYYLLAAALFLLF